MGFGLTQKKKKKERKWAAGLCSVVNMISFTLSLVYVGLFMGMLLDFMSVSPLSQHVHHFCQQCSPGSVRNAVDANAYPSDQSRPRRAMWMMQESYLSANIHHVQCAPDECQSSRARVGKVKGCQERSLPSELNKCFMNFKQLAVCLPAVLKDQRFRKKAEYRLIEGICIYLHSFWKHVNLPPFLRSVLQCVCVCLLCFFFTVPPYWNKTVFLACHFLLLISDLNV